MANFIREGTVNFDAESKRWENIIEQKKAREASEPPKIVQLQIKFHKEAPPAPNDLLRSAFFPAIQSKDRKLLNNEIIASVEGVIIKLKGEQLNQDDLDIFLVCQILAQQQATTLQFCATERGLLRLLGRKTGSDAQKALFASLIRLRSATFILESKNYKYVGGLIDDAFKDENTKKYVIRLNPRLNSLINNGSTFLDLEIRKKLIGKPLAQWLQANYASHVKPYGYKIEKIRQLSGSRTEELKKYRQMVRRALDDLKTIGEIIDWSIDENDKVHVVKGKKP